MADEDKTLLPIRKDIAEWLTKILGYRIRQENLFDKLRTGIILCQTANRIFQLAKHRGNRDDAENITPLPKPPMFSKKAKPCSFLARNNAANFITWCKKLGIEDTFLFESEGLVLQTQKENTLLCLLEVARRVSRHGLPMPQLIQLEYDIAHEEAKESRLLKQISHQNSASARVPPTMDRRKRLKTMNLDDAVHKIVDNSDLKGLVDIERIGEGRYRIKDKLVFIRMLRNLHVMVHVRGGWDTLEHYLLTCETTRFKQKFKLVSFTDTTKEQNDYQRTTGRKFHQIRRTRIPLRMKRC